MRCVMVWRVMVGVMVRSFVSRVRGTLVAVRVRGAATATALPCTCTCTCTGGGVTVVRARVAVAVVVVERLALLSETLCAVCSAAAGAHAPSGLVN